jgi:hypothetical protein
MPMIASNSASPSAGIHHLGAIASLAQVWKPITARACYL